jgi:fatty acid-binding protein DegV
VCACVVSGCAVETGSRLLLKPALRDVQRAARGADQRVRLLIAHAAAPLLAEELRRQCLARFPAVESIDITELGPAVGVHGGPGTVALAVQTLP